MDRSRVPGIPIFRKHYNVVLFWNYQGWGDLYTETAAPRWELRAHGPPSNAAFLIGIYKTRLVFYTVDHWVASYEWITPCFQKGSNVVEDSFVRHFFIPDRWVGS